MEQNSSALIPRTLKALRNGGLSLFFLFSLLVVPISLHAEELITLKISNTETQTVCTDIALGRWDRIKNYSAAVIKTGGLRLAFRPPEKTEGREWRKGVFLPADPERKIWMHPVLWLSRKISNRFARESWDFHPVLALEDRVLQPLVRGFTSRFLGKTFEFSRLLMLGMSLSISWLGWGEYTAYADSLQLHHQEQVVQDHAATWTFFIEHDHRFHQLRKMLKEMTSLSPQVRNQLAHEYRQKIVDQMQELQTVYLQVEEANGTDAANTWLLNKHGELFYSDILLYARNRIFAPNSEHILFQNFSPAISSGQIDKLIRIRNRSLFKYEFAYGLVTDPTAAQTRQNDLEALYRTEEERTFVRQVLQALKNKKITTEKALDLLHMEITWNDQLMSYTELGVALRAKNADGLMTDVPLTIGQIRQELTQIFEIK